MGFNIQTILKKQKPKPSHLFYIQHKSCPGDLLWAHNYNCKFPNGKFYMLRYTLSLRRELWKSRFNCFITLRSMGWKSETAATTEHPVLGKLRAKESKQTNLYECNWLLKSYFLLKCKWNVLRFTVQYYWVNLHIISFSLFSILDQQLWLVKTCQHKGKRKWRGILETVSAYLLLSVKCNCWRCH